jgi:hypothetical protein
LGSSPILPPDTTNQGDVSAIAFGLSALAIALAIFGYFFNSSLNVNLFCLIEIVAAALPWSVVWMQARWPQLVNVTGDKKDPRPSMVFVLMGSGFGLLSTQFQNLQIDAFSPLLVYACAPTAALSCALYLASPRDHQSVSKSLQLFILVAFYGFGLARQADTLLDRSAARQYSTQVTYKTTHRTGRGGTSYYLWLDVWVPGGIAEQASVKRGFYDSVAVGSTVCITARDGALDVPWYTIHSCRQGE